VAYVLYYGAAGGEGDFCVDGDEDEGGCVLEEVNGVKERPGDAVLRAEGAENSGLESVSADSALKDFNSCRKRIAAGSTEIMSPGARRVLASMCWKLGTSSVAKRQWSKLAHLFAIEQDGTVDDESPCLVDTMRKAALEHENINAPLHFFKHKTAHRAKPFIFSSYALFFALSNCSVCPAKASRSSLVESGC
jgi:hypothetical protein